MRAAWEHLASSLPADSYSDDIGCVNTHPLFDKIRYPSCSGKGNSYGLLIREVL